MTDPGALARAYLKQQQALGTDAVVLPDTATNPSTTKPAPPSLTPRQDFPTPGISPGNSEHPASSPLPPPGLSFDPPAVDLFANDPLQHALTVAAVAELVAECRKCRLCESRTHTVPGEGPADARLVVIGEGPGRTEDETGRPFVGKAGELLTKILAAIELPREQEIGRAHV